jgi:4-amino-4-deoxy-L-arabinose transferase-like glycosyltransferase
MSSRRNNRSRERRFRLAALALGVVAALHGLLYVSFVSPHTTLDTPTYLVPAHAILHGSYSTPLPRFDATYLRIPDSAVGTLERQTMRTPGYPLLLAAIGGGKPGWSRDLLYVVQALLCGGATWLLVLTARRLWGEHMALLSGVVYTLDPYSKRYVSIVLTEVLATFLAVAAAYAFVRARQQRSPAWWGVAGALTAAATLTRPVFALAIPLLLLAALLARPARWRSRALRVGACACATAIFLGPWLGWTTTVTGRPVLASFGEGWNLLLAAHGEGPRTTAEVEYSKDYSREFNSVHRFALSAHALRTDPGAHGRYLVRADAEQRRIAWHVYWRRFDHDPAQVLGEVLYRAAFLWSAHRDWRQPNGGLGLLALELVSWLTIAVASAGILLALGRRGPPREVALLLLVFTLVNAVHHVEARYSIPLRGLELAYAALALVTTARYGTSRRGRLGRQALPSQGGDRCGF